MAYIDKEKVEKAKTMIIGLLQEFIDEYKMYSASSIDYHYGRADGVETARSVVVRRLNTLLEEPTADVVEVKHGHWIEDCAMSTELGLTGEPMKVYRCSRCGRYEYSKEPYCNCGAKMDGGKEE